MNNNFIDLESSTLYRCNQKYYDKAFKEFGLGYSQFIFLASIFENEGMKMNELAINGAYDKGTITKSIAKLEEAGFIKIVDSKKDKRVKELYTTQKTRDLMPKLYSLRNDWLSFIGEDISQEEFKLVEDIMNKILAKAKDYQSIELISEGIHIYQFDKLNLSIYPGTMAAVIYTGGCNFRCPFCDKRDLVFLGDNKKEINIASIFDYLNKRKGFIDSVCISGGEPLIHDGLIDFLKEVKKLDYKIKLETNGSNFEKLKEIIDLKLVDFISLDIKNTRFSYPKSIGLSSFNMDEIIKSIDYLKKDYVDYEYKTTLTKELHLSCDFKKLGEIVKGGKNYCLNNFVPSDNCIEEGYSPLQEKDVLRIKETLKAYVKNVYIN